MPGYKNYTGPGPCEFFDCPMADHCKKNALACESYAAYLSKGRVIDPQLEIIRRGREGRVIVTKNRTPPVPSHKIYRRLFHSGKAA